MLFEWVDLVLDWLGIRDRPFNLKGGGGYVFLFRSENFLRTTQEVEYFFLLREARIFFPEFNIRLYGKNSESDYFFFPPPKSEYFFQQHWDWNCLFKILFFSVGSACKTPSLLTGAMLVFSFFWIFI